MKIKLLNYGEPGSLTLREAENQLKEANAQYIEKYKVPFALIQDAEVSVHNLGTVAYTKLPDNMAPVEEKAVTPSKQNKPIRAAIKAFIALTFGLPLIVKLFLMLKLDTDTAVMVVLVLFGLAFAFLISFGVYHITKNDQ